MMSASLMVDRRCATTTVVRPLLIASKASCKVHRTMLDAGEGVDCYCMKHVDRRWVHSAPALLAAEARCVPLPVQPQTHLYLPFCLGIQRGGRLVQQQDLRRICCHVRFLLPGWRVRGSSQQPAAQASVLQLRTQATPRLAPWDP